MLKEQLLELASSIPAITVIASRTEFVPSLFALLRIIA
jgi:hypothetical protein